MTVHDDFSRKIMKAIKSRRFSTLEELINYLEREYNVSRKTSSKYVLELYDDGLIKLNNPQEVVPGKLIEYIFTNSSRWFWGVVAFSCLSTIFAFLINEGSYPIVYVRYFFGAIFLIFAPGFSLTKALFPTTEIDIVERAAISIGGSLTLLTVTAIVLNYTGLGIGFASMIIGPLIVTLVLAVFGLVREHRVKRV